jgi:aromatic-L-amino-acid decarboxylase
MSGMTVPQRPHRENDAGSAAFDAEAFRRDGHAVIDWIAEYWQSLPRRPVLSSVAPGEVAGQLPAAAPTAPESLTAILADIDRVILPGLTHWQHPSFFAYFPANASAPSILGELLSAGLGVQGMLWATSPAATELEAVAVEWLRDLLGLPDRFCMGGPGGGMIQDSASSGLLCCLVAARERSAATVAGQPVVYCSSDAHSSVAKGARIAGFPADALRRIETDADGRMCPQRLAAALAEDRMAGRSPCFVVATVGTTPRGAIDPVAEIGAIARRHGAWLHVDAAWAGTAAICPEFRETIVAGADAADSWGTNPHKWMLVNFDCHCLWIADHRALGGALSIKPEYLRTAAGDSGAVVDYSDWQIPLGRRFRALKLWMVLRMTGAGALQERVRDHVAWTAEFARLVAGHPSFELLSPQSLALTTFALRAGDAATADLLAAVNRSGRAFFSHSRVAGRYAIRMAVGSTLTRRADVLAAWEVVAAAAPRG